MFLNQFKKPENIEKIIGALNGMDLKPIKIMEVCGTHTMSIAKSGIKSILPKNIRLVSGPGCPVCVTPAERIDGILALAKHREVIIATYGDMLKVPGSEYGESLEKYKALGANVITVYSPLDAVEIAKQNIDKEVVFLGIGFETTAPGTAIALESALEQNINNFYIFSLHKLVEPILRRLIEEDDFDIDGFLCPGHVAIIVGERGFEFLSSEYKIPSVIAGFEAGDILTAIYKVSKQIEDDKHELQNEYTRLVSYNGNIKALNSIYKYFEVCDDLWRGIGFVKNSGLRLKDEYLKFDAVRHFSIKLRGDEKITACRCGEVIKGRQEPYDCSLFGKLCSPENPLGPCMVSSEGACAAYYKYQV